MPEYVTSVFDWLASVPPLYAYLAILLIAWGENVVPPIPGDMVVVFAGYLVGLDRLDFVSVVLLSTLGGVAGFMTMYAIGRRVGEAVLDPHRLRWLPKHYIFKAGNWLQRYGFGVVAANRFLSGARSVISLTVGMVRMSVWKTTLMSTLSALIWTSLLTYAGFIVGDNWRVVGDYLKIYGKFMAVVVLAVILAVLLVRYRKKQLERRRARRRV